MAKTKDITNKLIVVCRESHPHYGCTGHFSGELINVFGTTMAKIDSVACSHGGGGFYVEPGDIREVKPRQRIQRFY